MTDIEIAKFILDNLKGGKLTDVRAQGGPSTMFILVFEAKDEQIATLSVMGGLKLEGSAAGLTVKPSIHFNLDTYKR